MALFNLKKPQPKQETEEIQTILPNPSEEIIPELNPEELSEISELLEIPEATEEIPAEAAPAEEKPKKKSILTMDLKDLFKGKKKKEQDDDDEDEDEEEKQPKKSILTMDLKDLVQLKPASKKGAVKRSKRTMNFVHHQRNFNLMKVLPPVLVAVAALIIFPLFDLIMTNFTSETFQYNVGDHIIEPIILGILFSVIMTFFQFRKKKTKKK